MLVNLSVVSRDPVSVLINPLSGCCPCKFNAKSILQDRRNLQSVSPGILQEASVNTDIRARFHVYRLAHSGFAMPCAPSCIPRRNGPGRARPCGTDLSCAGARR